MHSDVVQRAILIWSMQRAAERKQHAQEVTVASRLRSAMRRAGVELVYQISRCMGCASTWASQQPWCRRVDMRNQLLQVSSALLEWRLRRWHADAERTVAELISMQVCLKPLCLIAITSGDVAGLVGAHIT